MHEIWQGKCSGFPLHFETGGTFGLILYFLPSVPSAVAGRFGPIPVRTLGRFGPVPFRSGRFGLGRFSPILEVGRFGPIWWVVSAHFILYSF